MSKYDLIIVGAGLSGLLLAHRLRNSDQRILLIGPKDDRQQTISFWCHQNENQWYLKYQKKSWDRWCYQDTNVAYLHQSKKYQYTSLDAMSLRQDIRNQLESCKSLDLQEAWVEIITKNDNGFHLEVSGEVIHCHHLIDTRPPQMSQKTYCQHFLGMELQFEHGFTQPIIMDFEGTHSSAVNFTYVLPFSSNRLLIESTFFSYPGSINYESYIEKWMIKNTGFRLKDVTVVMQEKGVIPMCNYTQHDLKIPRVGLAGDAMRPASGYAFLNLLKQIDQVVSDFENRRNLKTLSVHPFWVKTMDRIFLNVLQSYPNIAPYCFMQLAHHMHADEYVAFLQAHCKLRTCLKVVSKLPKWHFIKYGIFGYAL